MQSPETASMLAFERPTIFPTGVLAGVTLRNPRQFPRTGLSLLKAQILSDAELLVHRQACADALSVPVAALRFQKQVHGRRVRLIDTSTANNADSNNNVSDNEESDGMITREQGLVLCAGMADCAAILLYDPVQRAVGAVHSGWGGTRQNIISEALAQMQSQFGSRAADVLAYVSPAASGERYEVRWDVAQYFPSSVLRRIEESEDAEDVSGHEKNEEFNHDDNHRNTHNNEPRWLLDNRKRIVEQMIECGLQQGNIEVSSGCTLADTSGERYHSHRRDGAGAGRMVAFIGLPD
jgi:polyphenol oxidase